jgi:hypothetical protein
MAICPSSRGLPGPETAEELGTGAEPPRRPPLRSGYVRVPTSRPTAFSVGVAVGLHALLVAAVTFVPVHRSSAPIRPHPLVEAVTYLTVQDWLPRASPGTPPVPSTQATGAGAVLGAPAAGQGAVVPDSFHSGAGDPGADAVPAHELHDARLGEPEVQRRSSRLGPELWDHRLVVPPDRQGTRTPASEEYLDEFRQRLAAFRDSLPFDEAREHRLREWTWTDAAGRLWGVREGMIIVNGTSIATEYHGERDQQASQRTQARRSRESQRQADDAERHRHLAERERAIRDRRSTGRGGTEH